MKKNSKSNTNPENSKSNTTYSQYKHIQKIYTSKKHNILTIQTHPKNSKSTTTYLQCTSSETQTCEEGRKKKEKRKRKLPRCDEGRKIEGKKK